MVHYMDVVGVSALAESVIKTADSQKKAVGTHLQQEEVHKARAIAALGGCERATLLRDVGVP